MNWADIIQTGALLGTTAVIMIQQHEIGRLQAACEMLRDAVQLLHQQQIDLEETMNAAT